MFCWLLVSNFYLSSYFFFNLWLLTEICPHYHCLDSLILILLLQKTHNALPLANLNIGIFKMRRIRPLTNRLKSAGLTIDPCSTPAIVYKIIYWIAPSDSLFSVFQILIMLMQRFSQMHHMKPALHLLTCDMQ